MARIRSIKPEFWTSEQIAECSPNTRLLFIGLWSFCDDGGVHPANPMRLKMEVFPADAFGKEDVADMVSELIDAELVEEYQVDGKRYWRVTGWNHQRIDQPTYKYPQPDGRIPDSPKRRRANGECSANNPRTFTGCSPPERSGEEWSGEDIDLSTPDGVEVDGEPTTHPPPCPHQAIIEAYHEILPMCPAVKAWNKTRAGYLRARWVEDPRRQSLDWWRAFFEHVAKSRFLTGGTSGSNGRPPFIANLEWILRPANFAKVIEGHYHQEVAA